MIKKVIYQIFVDSSDDVEGNKGTSHWDKEHLFDRT